jgi:general secretion pathway protein A
MFIDHFNLKFHPFAENFPTRSVLRVPRIEEAMARLTYFLEEGRLALIIGQTGVGKSILLKLFIQEIPQNRFNPLYLHLTPVSASAFLRMIVTELGETPKLGKDRLFMQISDRVRQNEKTTILIIDEAHMLDPKTLVDLRLLISTAEKELPLKIVLCGQEPLRYTLKRLSHVDLVHRISVKCFLLPLTRDQTASYIDNRMNCTGGNGKIFEPESKALIHEYTSGVPRQINNVATACLINATVKNLNKIDEPLVNQTMNEFDLT